MREEAPPTGRMAVRLNGKEREVEAGLTVAGLLERLALRPELIVVELNGEILDRKSFPVKEVRGGDEIELVHFVGGG